jgi:hypothetical protein
MNKFLLSISVPFFFCVSAFCQKTKERTISIEPYLSFQNYEHFKRLTLKSPDSEIESLEGFKFDWGYNYKIRVNETK